MRRILAAFALVLVLAPQAFAASDPIERQLMEARTFSRRGQHAQAAFVYEQLLRRYPDDLRVLGEYSTSLVILRRFPEAELTLKRLAAAEPQNETYPREMERVHRLQGHTKEAINDCVTIAVRFPSQAEWARTEIRSLTSANPELAVLAMDALESAAAQNPKRADLRILVAELAFDAGREMDAIADARAADAAGARNGEPLFALMGRARATGKRQVALTLGEELREKYPNASYRPRLLIVLGDLYTDSKQMPLALAAYQEAATAKPGSPEAVHARLLAGKLYQTELGDYGAALAQYSSMDRAALSADDREALLSLEADCHLRMGDLAKAAASFDALAAESADPEAKERAAFEKAELLFFQGKVTEATEGYFGLAGSFPTGRLVDDALDRIFLLSENGEGEGEALLKAFGDAEYRARVGDPVGAVGRLQTLVTDNPEALIVDDARFRIGAILAAAGRPEEGAQALHALAVDLPDSKYAPRALRRAGDLWREVGRPEEALKEYQQLFSKYPQSLDADEVRAAAEDLRRKVGS